MQKLLKNLNLSQLQIQVYQELLAHGVYKPAELAQVAGLNRSSAYKALYELEDMNLIVRDQDGGGELCFRPKSPTQLNLLVKRQERHADKLRDQYLQSLPQLLSMYEQVGSDPLVDKLAGLSGLKKFHLLMEKAESPISLIRSVDDRLTPVIAKEIDRHVKARTKLGIPVRIITPVVETTKYTLRDYPQVKNRQMRFLPGSANILTQLAIFDNYLAITNYRDEFVTLLIRQPHIRETFAVLFELLWETAVVE